MSKPFKLLRLKLLEKEIDQKYLSELMHQGLTYVNQRFTGNRAWNLADQYFLMDLLHIPYDQMHIYFPKSDLKCAKSA